MDYVLLDVLFNNDCDDTYILDADENVLDVKVENIKFEDLE